MIFQYVCNNAATFRVDIDSLKLFLRRMHTLEENITSHNSNYIERTLIQEKEYFDNILIDIDPNIRLDDEQRRAVITDDDYCLLVAGAGAGKTTTMAAKVKYLVEKKHINPEEIIVISYTNKAIGELRERHRRSEKTVQRNGQSLQHRRASLPGQHHCRPVRFRQEALFRGFRSGPAGSRCQRPL